MTRLTTERLGAMIARDAEWVGAGLGDDPGFLAKHDRRLLLAELDAMEADKALLLTRLDALLRQNVAQGKDRDAAREALNAVLNAPASKADGEEHF